MAERLTTNQEVPGSTPGWIVTTALVSPELQLLHNANLPLYFALDFTKRRGDKVLFDEVIQIVGRF